jgi:hypothetical protein
MKGIITAMAPVTPETKTVYGQKEATSKTAAGILGGVASALGIKTLDDLTKKASEYGLTVANFKKLLGISENATGSVRNETDLSKLTPEELQRLHEQENPGGGGGEGGGGATEPVGLTDEVAPILPPEGDENNYGGYGEGYSAAAQGGLVDLLHKMRSHK